jgi:small-conductance mechanosensitive channel
MQSLIAKRVATMSVLRSSVSLPMATFATKGPLDGKQKGDEKVFFDKEDQTALKKLLKKLQDQEKQVKAEEETASKHELSLKNLFKDNNIDEEKNKDLFKDLLEWRKKI